MPNCTEPSSNVISMSVPNAIITCESAPGGDSNVMIGKGDEETAWARQVLDSRDRTKGGMAAPAHGLTLTIVDYPERHDLP